MCNFWLGSAFNHFFVWWCYVGDTWGIFKAPGHILKGSLSVVCILLLHMHYLTGYLLTWHLQHKITKPLKPKSLPCAFATIIGCGHSFQIPREYSSELRITHRLFGTFSAKVAHTWTEISLNPARMYLKSECIMRTPSSRALKCAQTLFVCRL